MKKTCHQKLSFISENKVFQKLKLTKIVKKLIFLNEKIILRKIQMNFDIENWMYALSDEVRESDRLGVIVADLCYVALFEDFSI